MVTDKPPRRTKSNKEPVTIDGTASKPDVVAEPVRSNDSDDTASSTDKPAQQGVTSTSLPVGDTTTGSDPGTTAAAEAKPQTVAAPVHSSDTDQMAGSVLATPPKQDAAPKNGPKNEKTTERGPETTGNNPARPEKSSGSDEASPTAAPSYRSAETTASAVPPSSRTQPAGKGTATSTLVAAGIFGGIVALALAGSMQYAGYLPAASPDGDVTDEIASLRQQVETLSQAPAANPEIDTRLQAVESAVAAASDGPSEELTARLSTLEQELAALRTSAEGASSETSGRLDQLQQRLEAAETELNEPGAEEAAARAIAAAALKAAVDRGSSFESELQTFASVAPEDPAVAQLESFSEQGVPTRSQLVEQFSALSDDILEAAQQPDEDQGIAGRLMSSAMSVVKVRRTGDAEGETAEAIVSRMENALQNENLQAAASEWENLPQEAKAVSQDFKQALDARIAIDSLLGDTLTRAVSETRSSN
jgi:hypothetical protein